MQYEDEEATNSSDIYGEGLNHPNVQSVLFERPLWTITQAKRWLTRKGFEKKDVDEKPEHFRFRQIEPDQRFKYITKEVDNGVKYILIINRSKGETINRINNMPRRRTKSFEYDSDSSSASDSSTESIVRGMKGLKTRIMRHHEMKGGKIKIAKEFKKLGSTIKRGFEDKFVKPAGKYITSKKGGLASDLLHEGVPIVTGALAGAAGDMVGGPLLGVAAGEATGRLTSYGMDKLGQKIGVGVGGEMVHIDIGSHNARGRRATAGEGMMGDIRKTMRGLEASKKKLDAFDQSLKGEGVRKRRSSKSAVQQLIDSVQEREIREMFKDSRKLQKAMKEEKGLMPPPPKYSRAIAGEGMHEKMARLRAMRKPKGSGLTMSGIAKKTTRGIKKGFDSL